MDLAEEAAWLLAKAEMSGRAAAPVRSQSEQGCWSWLCWFFALG